MSMEVQEPREIAGFANNKKPKKTPSRVLAWALKQLVKIGRLVTRRKKLATMTVFALVLIAFGGHFIFFNKNKPGTKGPNTVIASEFAARLPELEQAVKNNPKDVDARKNYAVALYATRDFDNARKQYEEVIKLSPKDATAHNNLGNTWRDLKDFNKAVEAYRKAIKLNPAMLNAYINLANVQLYNLGKADDAVATYKHGLNKLPNNTQLELLLGMAYEQANNFTEAKQTYQNILAREGDNQAAKASLERVEQK